MEKKSSIIKPFGGVNVSSKWLFITFMQILDKKVKKNPKYDGVKSVISTGKTMKDVEIMSKWVSHNDALISLFIRSILFINHDLFRWSDGSKEKEWKIQEN
jgi:hypothetical protein